MLTLKIHPKYAGHSVSGWMRIQESPEIVTRILSNLERHEQVPMAGVSKKTYPHASKLLWRSVDSRALLFLVKGLKWKKKISIDINDKGENTVFHPMIRLVQYPTEADWKRWEPLAAHTEVYRDQSCDEAYGIETEEIIRILSTRRAPHLFPNLRKVFILESHISPLFLSPTLSELHLTIGCKRVQTGHDIFMEDDGLWISDYVQKLKILHVYPNRTTPTSHPSISTRNCIHSLIDAVRHTLLEASFPPYYVDWTLLRPLLQCPNLLSIGTSPYPLAGPMQSSPSKGLRDNILVSYEHAHFPMNLAHPFEHIKVLDLSFPYPDVAKQVFREMALPQLDSITLSFTVLQPDNVGHPSLNKFSLTPLLYQLHRCAPSLRHLKLFMVPQNDECNYSLMHVPEVNWIDLSPITLFRLLVSFEIAHVWPINVSSRHVGRFLVDLPHLRRFILNPRPVILTNTQYGVDILFVIAAHNEYLTHLGIFMNGPQVMPVLKEGSFFRDLRTLYVGASLMPDNDSMYNAVCHALYYLLPPNAKIKTYPSESAAFFSPSAFLVEEEGELDDIPGGYVKEAEKLWACVKASITHIRETVQRVGGTHMIRREDMM